MLDVLNLLFLGATMLADIQLYNTGDVVLPPLGEVAPITFRHEAYSLLDVRIPASEDGKCHYTGLVVPYERTWEERTTSSMVETVLPPEPGKVAGYALLINKKGCPGQESEPMFRISTRDERGIFFNRGKMMKGYPTQSVQLASLRDDLRPQWLPQVLETVARTAEINPVAKEFIDYTRQAEEAAKAGKNQRTTQAQ